MNSFSFEERTQAFTRLKPGLAIRLLSKGLFYIRAMTSVITSVVVVTVVFVAVFDVVVIFVGAFVVMHGFETSRNTFVAKTSKVFIKSLN